MASGEDFDTSGSSDDLFTPATSKRCRRLLENEDSSSSDVVNKLLPSGASDSETNIDENDTLEKDLNWRFPQANQVKMTFSNFSGINTIDSNISNYTEPHNFYFLFATEEVFEIIAEQTNIYAAQIKSEHKSQLLDEWTETNPNEIKRFLGLIIWMGLVRLPQIKLYWSTNEGYNQTFPSTVMSHNRFELLLRYIHFSNNRENDPNNRLSKINKITNILNTNFKKYYNLSNMLCVNESLVPFQGCIKFRPYLEQKRRQCGIKVFKLCGGAGYIYSLHIYTRKEQKGDNLSGCKSAEDLMNVCKELFRKSHTICRDNWYTSAKLGEKLIDMHTYLAGENKKGMTSLTQKDKRDVAVLSTKHSVEMTTVNKKSSQRPEVVVEYNLGKASVDLSDQMTLYSSPLGRTVKWYKKLVMELLLNTCIVNALVIFREVTCKSIKIPDFRMKIAMHLTKCGGGGGELEECIPLCAKQLNVVRHEIKKMPGKVRTTRQICRKCYEENKKRWGRTKAKNCTKKVATYCPDCIDSPFLCLDCFNKVHRNMPT